MAQNSTTQELLLKNQSFAEKILTAPAAGILLSSLFILLGLLCLAYIPRHYMRKIGTKWSVAIILYCTPVLTILVLMLTPRLSEIAALFSQQDQLYLALVPLLVTFFTLPILFGLLRLLCLIVKNINSGEPFHPGQWRLLEILYCAFFYLVIMFAVSIPLHRFSKLSEENFYIILLVATILIQVLACAQIYFFLSSSFGKSVQTLGLAARNCSWKFVTLVPLSYILFFPVSMALYWLSLLFLISCGVAPEAQSITDYIIQAQGLPFYFGVFTAIVAAPVLEEFLYRSFLYTGLRNIMGVSGAAVVSALIFSLIHQNGLAFLPIFGLGIFLALLYESSQSLWAPVLAHCCHNSLSLFWLLSS